MRLGDQARVFHGLMRRGYGEFNVSRHNLGGFAVTLWNKLFNVQLIRWQLRHKWAGKPAHIECVAQLGARLPRNQGVPQ